MLPPVFALLNVAPVTALVGTNPVRVFPWGEAPEGTAYPYVTWGVISGVPDNQLSGSPCVDSINVQVDVWAKTAASAVAVATAVRNAIEPSAHMVNFGSTERDPDTGSYRYRMSFDFWQGR